MVYNFLYSFIIGIDYLRLKRRPRSLDLCPVSLGRGLVDGAPWVEVALCEGKALLLLQSLEGRQLLLPLPGQVLSEGHALGVVEVNNTFLDELALAVGEFYAFERHDVRYDVKRVVDWFAVLIVFDKASRPKFVEDVSCVGELEVDVA